MISINPQSLSLLAAAASGIIGAVPKGQLARFGLMRAPLAAPLAVSSLPLAAAAGGVLAVALMVPSSRQWLMEKATILKTAVRSRLLENGVSEDRPVSATDGAKRPGKTHRAKDSPIRKPAQAE